MVLLASLQQSGSLRRRDAGGHHAALRPRPFRVVRAPPLAAPPAAQPWGPAAAAQQQRNAARPRVQAGAAQQSAGQPHPGIDGTAAAYLEQHGVSTAQLQEEQPAAAAALTLPLARLLVRAVEARQGPYSRNTLAAPELAARLVFLASEAGVPVVVLGGVYMNQLVYLGFKLDSAREVLAWLRANLPDGTLQRAAAWNPEVWSSLRPTLVTTKADLQQMFGLSHAKWVEAVHSNPQLLTSFSQDTAEKVVRWLRRDVGMPEGDISRLFNRQPSVFLSLVSSLSEVLEYVLDRLHIDRGKAAYVVLNCSLLPYSKDALESKVADLEQYGFTASQIGKMLLSCHLLLGCTYEGVISPALSELEQLLTGHLPSMAHQEQQAAVIEVAVRAGGLLTSKPAKLRGNFDFVLRQGLSPDAAREVLLCNPQVFALDMKSKGFEAKLRYYESELGTPVVQMLVKYSTYLKEGLTKVDQRVFCMERRGELQRLWPSGERRPGNWMKLSMDAFYGKFSVSLEEWEECMAEWRSSERAQQYGLVGQASKRSFNVDYKKVSAAAKESNSRRRRRK